MQMVIQKLQILLKIENHFKVHILWFKKCKYFKN